MHLLLKLWLILLLMFSLAVKSSLCQSQYTSKSIFDYLQTPVDDKQIIHIQQDSSVIRLIDKHMRIKQQMPVYDGYRIQIFSGSGKEAREKISQVRGDFLTAMPGFDASRIYPVYQPPFFKIRVGDYRTKAEAFPVYKQIIRKFPTAYIVKEKINPPRLE